MKNGRNRSYGKEEGLNCSKLLQFGGNMKNIILIIAMIIVLSSCTVRSEEKQLVNTYSIKEVENTHSFRTETKQETSESKKSNATNNSESNANSNNNANANNQPSNNTNNQNTKPVGSNNKPSGHYETRTEVIPAWDEKILVKEGYYETVLVKETYDEKQTYCLIFGYDKIRVFICGQCGHQASSYDAINAHFDSSESCGSYSEQDIDTGEAHCLSYGEDIIHHDAVYEKIYHEPEYTTIHHPEEIKEYQVWVND